MKNWSINSYCEGDKAAAGRTGLGLTWVGFSHSLSCVVRGARGDIQIFVFSMQNVILACIFFCCITFTL